ncbi:Mitochondrial mRNA-processing protein cox24 [Vanrija pseudolonga]|uniref:Small ribosomal subunit protein mS38 n=1 Tax=Vanrija pseudolonga TaxID=143232 RepID=A0AAF0Y1U1_9TREE|nr:Mitochondrial mRNA-processing protein cox24 [Vanrija pseudolonga]
MLLRRLYSSPASRAAAAPLEASSTTRAPTRGRSRPVRVALKRTPVVAPVAAEPTRGRRLRRALAPAPAAETTSEMPFSTQFSFRPVTLFPFQAGLHLGFTPAHMPLPVHAGTASYLQPGRGATASFERPAAPSALDALASAPASNGSSLGDHLRLTRAFAHPAMSHHLGQQAAAPSVAVLDVDHDTQVTAALDAAASRHAEAAGSVWDAALARLGGRVAEPAAPSAAEQASLDDALKGLNGLLARLDVTAIDEVVSLDSVKRKRKKKMNKHKYQKRRKASRAERKRLGK